MARGVTDIHLVGGKRDGDIIKDVSVRSAFKTIPFRDDSFFYELPDGSLQSCDGDLNDAWHSFSVDIYAKFKDGKHEKGIVYKFAESVIVNRCSAITKKGKRCKKHALDGTSYCNLIHKTKC